MSSSAPMAGTKKSPVTGPPLPMRRPRAGEPCTGPVRGRGDRRGAWSGIAQVRPAGRTAGSCCVTCSTSLPVASLTRIRPRRPPLPRHRAGHGSPPTNRRAASRRRRSIGTMSRPGRYRRPTRRGGGLLVMGARVRARASLCRGTFGAHCAALLWPPALPPHRLSPLGDVGRVGCPWRPVLLPEVASGPSARCRCAPGTAPSGCGAGPGACRLPLGYLGSPSTASRR